MEVMAKTKPCTTTDQSDEKLVEIKEERVERSLKKEDQEEDHQIINGNCRNNLGNISELCSMDEIEKSKVDKIRALLKTLLPDSFEVITYIYTFVSLF